jgi:hypothetical protein
MKHYSSPPREVHLKRAGQKLFVHTTYRRYAFIFPEQGCQIVLGTNIPKREKYTK